MGVRGRGALSPSETRTPLSASVKRTAGMTAQLRSFAVAPMAFVTASATGGAKSIQAERSIVVWMFWHSAAVGSIWGNASEVSL